MTRLEGGIKCDLSSRVIGEVGQSMKSMHSGHGLGDGEAELYCIVKQLLQLNLREASDRFLRYVFKNNPQLSYINN